jgi:PAP2 superfamily/PEP-CTERM motif
MTKFTLKFLTTAMLITGITTPTCAATPLVTGNVVLYWQQILQTTPVGPPPTVSRDIAMANVAIHDAVNATVGNTDKSYLGAVANLGGDTRAAASVAAHNVLVQVDPTHAATYDAALAASLALVSNGTAKTNGMATGAAFAAAVIANRANDGTAGNVFSVPTGGIGAYVPPVPGPPGAVFQQLATATPFVMNSPSQFRSGPPPAIGSAAYAAAYNEVKDIGSATSMTRLADQTAAALFWDPLHGNDGWIQAAIDQSTPKNWTSLQYASMFATLAAGVEDAQILAWDDKVTYDLWRPITAITKGDTDGNPLTIGDPNWTSLLVAPPFQSYISAHSVVNETAATILAGYLGNSNHFCLTSGAASRCWDSFDAAALESGLSREWGGIHFNFDDSAGYTSGQQLGRYILSQNAFGAVPEPTSWMMMFGGFALVGAAMRRRQPVFAAIV